MEVIRIMNYGGVCYYKLFYNRKAVAESTRGGIDDMKALSLSSSQDGGIFKSSSMGAKMEDGDRETQRWNALGGGGTSASTDKSERERLRLREQERRRREAVSVFVFTVYHERWFLRVLGRVVSFLRRFKRVSAKTTNLKKSF